LLFLGATYAALGAAGGISYFVEVVVEKVDCFGSAENLGVVRVVQAMLIQLVLILRIWSHFGFLSLRKQRVSTVRILGSLDSVLQGSWSHEMRGCGVLV
jgi:hypothetical protein